MIRSIAVLCLLFCYVQCHVFVLGSRGGVTPVSTNPPYISVNNQAPCGGVANGVAEYFNVTKGFFIVFPNNIIHPTKIISFL